MTQKIAIVIPVYNEEKNLPILCERLFTITGTLNQYSWEFIFVDDGSKDQSVEILRGLQQAGKPITILKLSRNFGHQAAIKAGLDHVDADAVITMDADLQHPPELIPRLINEWQGGFDVVQTVRKQIESESLNFRSTMTSLAYDIINYFSDRPIPPNCADFRLISKKVLDELKKLPQVNPTLRAQTVWVGFKQKIVEYQVQERLNGQSRFTFRQLINLLAGGIFDMSRKPLGFGTSAGIILFIAGFFGWIIGLFSGTTFYVFFLTSIILLSMGLIGTYLGRAYYEALDRPLYIISEKINFQ